MIAKKNRRDWQGYIVLERFSSRYTYFFFLIGEFFHHYSSHYEKKLIISRTNFLRKLKRILGREKIVHAPRQAEDLFPPYLFMISSRWKGSMPYNPTQTIHRLVSCTRRARERKLKLSRGPWTAHRHKSGGSLETMYMFKTGYRNIQNKPHGQSSEKQLSGIHFQSIIFQDILTENSKIQNREDLQLTNYYEI